MLNFEDSSKNLEKMTEIALKLAKKPEDPREIYFEASQIVEFENLENRGQGLELVSYVEGHRG